MKWLFALVLFFVTASAQAGAFSRAGVIKELYFFSSYVMIDVEGSDDNPDNCNSGAFYVLNVSHGNYQAIVSALLASEMTKGRVTFWLGGCGGQGGNYPVISTARVYPPG